MPDGIEKNQEDTDFETRLLAETSHIVCAYVSGNNVGSDNLPGLITSVADALRKGVTGNGEEAEEEKPVPAVPPRKSVFPDYIICLEDGKKLKLLRRHLKTAYNMTPQQYRDRWGLPPEYPMVAPNYANHRSSLARRIGLGRRRDDVDEPAQKPVPLTKTGAAAPKAAAKAASEE